MTTFKDRATNATNATAGKFTLAQVLEILAGGRLPVRFTAYDGSAAGPQGAPFGLDLLTPRGTTYLATGRATAPGRLPTKPSRPC